jgi:hypothetical protein
MSITIPSIKLSNFWMHDEPGGIGPPPGSTHPSSGDFHHNSVYRIPRALATGEYLLQQVFAAHPG